MSGLLDLLTSQLSGSQLSAMSRQLGAEENATKNAMGAALPVLLGALARNSAKPDGAASLHGALSKDHDGSVLDNLSGFLGKPDTAAGDGILKHVLGGRRSAVETGVSHASGLDGAKVTQLMAMLAPVVMGAVGRTQRQQNLDASGVANMLAGERQRAESGSPALGDLARLLDSDGDGQIADDVAKLGNGLLGNLFGRRS
jgi:hypothetical protein